MNKTTKAITVITMILLIVSLVGNFYLMNNREVTRHVQIQSAEEEYEQKYIDFDNQTKKTKKALFEGSLAAGTSPTEVKYLLLKLEPDLTDEEKDTAIAQYINHLQYFASTYTNVALMYSNILQSLITDDGIDFSTREAAFQVSDKVLRNLLLEIWDSDMMLYIPDNSNNSPSVIVDYDGLMVSYADFITDTTKEYLELKTKIINGSVSNEDGSINYDNIETFMDDTFNFIYAHPDFAIIEDVEYMYVVAAKMYLDIYLPETSEIEYSEEAINRLNDFILSHPSTPASDMAKLIVNDVSKNGKLTSDVLTTINNSFSSLINS